MQEYIREAAYREDLVGLVYAYRTLSHGVENDFPVDPNDLKLVEGYLAKYLPSKVPMSYLKSLFDSFMSYCHMEKAYKLSMPFWANPHSFMSTDGLELDENAGFYIGDVYLRSATLELEEPICMGEFYVHLGVDQPAPYSISGSFSLTEGSSWECCEYTDQNHRDTFDAFFKKYSIGNIVWPEE